MNRRISFFRSIASALNKNSKSFSDTLKFNGHLEVTVKKKGIIIDYFELKNIILYNGNQKSIDSLVPGTSNYKIFRMAVGSEGTMESDKFQPKIPTKDMTALYHEVFRTDVYNPPAIGTRLATFTADFNSIDVPDSSFTNASERYVNEAMLILGDGTFGGGNKYYPQTPDADESGFSIRTFKSIPFDAGDDITITIRWTIYAQ